ncbi:MAG: hypothetical protein ABSD71_00295 [Bacteroidales bacterium]
MIPSRIRKSKKQILSLFEYLKESGVTCEVDLYYLDEDFKPNGRKGVHIDLNKIPMNIINGEENYILSIIIHDTYSFVLENHRPQSNGITINQIELLMDECYGEEIINYKRLTRLNDILNDPNPHPLI